MPLSNLLKTNKVVPLAGQQSGPSTPSEQQDGGGSECKPPSPFFNSLKRSDREMINHTIAALLTPSHAPPASQPPTHHPPKRTTQNHRRAEILLSEFAIFRIVALVKMVFLSEPPLLEIDAPINVCGDTHGQFHDLLRLFEMCGFPEQSNYLFLGDYVDRAKQGIETIILLFCYRLKYSTTFFLLRGNHECNQLNRIYGFYDECKRRYTVKLWHHFGDCFNCMPLAAIVGGKVFCVHGGISPSLDSMSQIVNIRRPTEVPEEGLVCDLLWSDPDPTVRGWCESIRGVSYAFGHDTIHRFCEKFDMDLICRAHQVVEDGYEFQANRRLVTVFSAPNYCGEFDNAAGVLVINKDFLCSFKVLRPASHKPIQFTSGRSSSFTAPPQS